MQIHTSSNLITESILYAFNKLYFSQYLFLQSVNFGVFINHHYIQTLNFILFFIEMVSKASY